MLHIIFNNITLVVFNNTMQCGYLVFRFVNTTQLCLCRLQGALSRNVKKEARTNSDTLLRSTSLPGIVQGSCFTFLCNYANQPCDFVMVSLLSH